MNAIIVLCGNLLDGISETMSGPMEILVQGKRITSVGRSVERPPSAQVIDFSDRTVSPRFIDTHVHLTMDAANLARQTLDSSASKALKGLSLARLYMSYGFTTLRDLDSADPDWPTIDLRDAINAGIVQGPRIFVAAHIISASAGHGDLRSFYNPRWTLPVSTTADDPASVRALVRREHSYGSDWIKTTRTHLINAAVESDSSQDVACLRNSWHTARTGRQVVESSAAKRITVQFSTVCSSAANGGRPGSCSYGWSGGCD